MRSMRSYGSVRGAISNDRPYRDLRTGAVLKFVAGWEELAMQEYTYSRSFLLIRF